MRVERISMQQKKQASGNHRPLVFDDFIGQNEIKKVLKVAIKSAKSMNATLGHILFAGKSGFGKTSLAHIVARSLGSHIKIITGYAIQKPSDMVSLLNTLERNTVLFIDEIHRIKSVVEEVLYIAMEDYRVDMILPEGGSVSIPLEPFTLIGATTKVEKLSTPLRNRFVYKFHFHDYSLGEKIRIVEKYLNMHNIILSTGTLIRKIAECLPCVPREITNICTQIRDYLVAQNYGSNTIMLDEKKRNDFQKRSKLQKGGITRLHQNYLHVLKRYYPRAVGLKTLSAQLGVSEQIIEDDLEPLLFKLGKIEKTQRGRVLIRK